MLAVHRQSPWVCVRRPQKNSVLISFSHVHVVDVQDPIRTHTHGPHISSLHSPAENYLSIGQNAMHKFIMINEMKNIA